MKYSQKGFIVPILVAVIAMLVIGGGVYVYEKHKPVAPIAIDTTIRQSNQIQSTDTQTSVVNVPSNNSPTMTVTPNSTQILSNLITNWKKIDMSLGYRRCHRTSVPMNPKEIR